MSCLSLKQSLPVPPSGSEARAALRSAAAVSLLLFFYACIPDPYLEPLNRCTAFLLAACLENLGVTATLSGAQVLSTSFSVRIIPDCTPALSLIIFWAFVVAQEVGTLWKIAAVLSGVPVLFTVNTLRLALIFLICTRFPDLFHAVHVVLGQVLMFGGVVALALCWSRFRTQVAQEGTTLFFLARVVCTLGLLFVPWLYLQHYYLGMIGELAGVFWRLLGFSLRTAFPPELHYSTFSIILFAALILSTVALGRGTRMRSLLIGVSAITLTQFVMIVVGNASFLLGGAPGWLYVMYKAVCCAHLTLPVLLWVLAVKLGRAFPDQPIR